MSEAGAALSSNRRVRRWRSISEKIRIVELTLKPGASVSEVARAHGVNANQVFKWRRAFERGELSESSGALIPVRMATATETIGGVERTSRAVCGGSIHIEFPGLALITVESGADPSLLQTMLESLRK